MKIDKFYVNDNMKIKIISVVPEENETMDVYFGREPPIYIKEGKKSFRGSPKWAYAKFGVFSFIGCYHTLLKCLNVRYASDGIKAAFDNFELYDNVFIFITSPLWIAGIIRACKTHVSKKNDEYSAQRVIPFTSEVEAKRYISENKVKLVDETTIEEDHHVREVYL